MSLGFRALREFRAPFRSLVDVEFLGYTGSLALSLSSQRDCIIPLCFVISVELAAVRVISLALGWDCTESHN